MTNSSNTDFGVRRFVVLHHTGIEQPHYDFMFDTRDDSQLVTFRLQAWPLLKGQTATRLRDHRRAYLDFQGAIPGDRGQVHRIDEGRLQVAQTAKGWLLRHSDGKPWLELELEQNMPVDAEANWWVTLLEDASGS